VVTALTPNADLAYRVLDQIDAYPETWDQSTWDCGTSACFAGWAVRLSGWKVNTDQGISQVVIDGPEHVIGLEIDEAAQIALGSDCYLRRDDADDPDDPDDLFFSCNTREDLGRLVAGIFGPRPSSYGTGCSCDYLGGNTPEHAPGAFCPKPEERAEGGA
jgi:hypothetical protein